MRLGEKDAEAWCCMFKTIASGSKSQLWLLAAGLIVKNINARQPVKLDGPEKEKQRATYAWEEESGGPPGGIVWAAAVGKASQGCQEPETQATVAAAVNLCPSPAMRPKGFRILHRFR